MPRTSGSLETFTTRKSAFNLNLNYDKEECLSQSKLRQRRRAPLISVAPCQPAGRASLTTRKSAFNLN